MRDYLIGIGVIVGWLFLGVLILGLAAYLSYLTSIHTAKSNPADILVFVGALSTPLVLFLASDEITRLGYRTRMRFSK